MQAEIRYYDLEANVELGKAKVDEEDVKAKLLKHFAQLFEAKMQTKSAVL